MADESMLSLFGADSSNFLDELTGPGPPPPPLPSQPQQQGLPTMLPAAGQDQEYMRMDDMQQLQQQHSMPQDPLISTMQQQAQQQGSYPQMNDIADQSYGAMSSNMAQQYSTGGEAFSQFGTQKLHHLDDSMLSTGQGSQQPIQSHSPQRQVSAPQQFGSPASASGMIQQRPTVRFPAYSTQAKIQPRNMGMQGSPMPVGQRMPIPHEQQPQQQHAVGMSQTNMWSQQQQQTPNQSQNYLQQQQSQQQMPGGGLQQMRPQYLTHHEYGLPNDTPQMAPRLSHYPTSNVPQQQQNVQYMHNMNQMQHVVRMPMSSPTAPTNPMNPFVTGSQVMNSDVSNITTNSYNGGKQQAAVMQQKAFGNDFAQQGPKMTPTASQPGKLQHYQYPNQQMSSTRGAMGMSDTQVLTHYPNSSPTQTAQYKTPYPTQQQRIPTSPRPTPPPTRNASDQLGHMPSQSPSNVQQQTSLQQLEQLVSPQMVGSPTGQNPYRQVVQTIPESSPNASLSSMPSPTGSNHSFSGAAASYLPNNQTILSTCSTPSPGALSGNVPNCPMSPNRGGKRPSPQNITVDIQQSQQQLQQLYSMAQSPQIQQKVLEVQERIRQLKAQQMLQMQQPLAQMQSPPLQGGSTMQQQGSSNVQQQQPATVQPHPTMQTQHPVKQQTTSPAATSPTTNALQKVQIITVKAPKSSPNADMSPQVPTSLPQSSQPSQVITQPPQVPPQSTMNSLPIFAPGGATVQLTTTPGIQPTLPAPIAIHQESSATSQTARTQPSDATGQPGGATVQLTTTPLPSSQMLVNQQRAVIQGIGGLSNFQQPTATMVQQPQQLDQMSTPSRIIQVQIQPGMTLMPIHTSIPTPESLENGEKSVKRKKVRIKSEMTRAKKEEMQAKADRIIQEAIAKAAALGNSVPGVQPVTIPTTVTDTGEELSDDKKPSKRKYKRKDPKEPKTPKTPKTPKEPKEPKPKVEKEKKVKTPKEKSIKKKKKPPATFLQKKKKKIGSDGSDMELTPPPSPENDDENGLQKRRSGRHMQRKKYLDEVDLNLSEDESQDIDVMGLDGAMENPTEDDAIVVEKILGMRMRKLDKDDQDAPDEEEEDEEEFYVKYKNFSYLHCEWKTIKELEKDKRIHMKIKRYQMKRLQSNNYFTQFEDDEMFNPEYVEVDRVLEESKTIDPVSEEELTHYLVKWRGLPYEDSTWELQQDVDPQKVQTFRKFNNAPEEDDRERVPRPDLDHWKAIEETKEYKGGNILRDYQLEGINWLTFSWYNERNCILADEMGLGKTIQTIAFLHEIQLAGIIGPFLIVVPLSTIGNWQREFEIWTDMNIIVYHGSSQSRNMLQEYEMYFRDEEGKRIPNIYKFHAIITTFEIIISDCELLNAIEWRCIIIDEAHRLKNRNCRLLEGLKSFDVDHRVLLTGTPLQNNVEELFSLLNFLEPEQFQNSAAFLQDFGDMKSENQVEKLKSLLKPMMLRRLKEDVEKSLAPKEETIVEVELTNIQKKYYRAIIEKNFAFLSKGATSNTNVPNLMNTMMELRKCCNHPFLIKGAEDKIINEVREKSGEDDHDHIFQAMVQSSGKLVLIDKLLPKLKQGGHKVLIFSQMIRVLDILEDYLIHNSYLYERLDGRIRGNMRQEAIDRFSKPDSDRFAFLLCTRAGGLGINLTAADTVIIFDSDWNPQNDLQAQARCHRIGQSKSVKVYRLVTRNSYEREMFDRASMKLGLDRAVLQSMGGDKQLNSQNQMSKKEIEDLLRKGAYGALMEEDGAGDKFCEEDIDQILKRRTQVIQIESEVKGSIFAKASFSVSGNRNDIDINDPNFWQKWAKKADLDVDEMEGRNNLILEEPRQRKQTARYATIQNDNSMVNVSDLESSSESDDDDGTGSVKRLGGKRRRRRTRGGEDGDFDIGMETLSGEGYGRSECFKVEKNLLVYGWGRWSDILAHGRFKKLLCESDVEAISQALLLYSLQYYKGDDRIKAFILDLVSPSNDGMLKNHSGLSAPVPRGRKGKKLKKECSTFDIEQTNLEVNPEKLLLDKGYKKHLQRHSNKVLLRVRLLYYLKQEVIGLEAERVFQGFNAMDIDIPMPWADGIPPAIWWDEEGDRSLLVGIFKHGYEKYNQIRQDPALCFLSRCGPPDGAALLAEMKDEDDNENNDDDEDKPLKDEEDEDDISVTNTLVKKLTSTPTSLHPDGETVTFSFPSASELNSRLRRVITCYQRNHKRNLMKKEQRVRKLERHDKLIAAVKEREEKKKDSQQRWSRREEADFYRVISTFGVEFDRTARRYRWERFRSIAHLDRKFDHTLTEYFHAFYHMCMKVCRRFRSEEEARPPNHLFVEPITEERASRCLARIDILNKIREETLGHPKLEERLQLCQPSYEMPTWWVCGKHDKELLIAAARHGAARTDYHYVNDGTLSFKDMVNSRVSSPYTANQGGSGCGTPRGGPGSFRDDESDMEVKVALPNISPRVNNVDNKENVKLEMKTEPTETNAVKTETINEASPVKMESSPVQLEKESKDRVKKEITENGDSEKAKVTDDEITESDSETKLTYEAKDDIVEEIKSVKEEDYIKNLLMEEEGTKMSDKEVASQRSTPGLQTDDTGLDLDSNEPTVAELLARNMQAASQHWPKDKHVFRRLEHICYCVQNGEWPQIHRNPLIPSAVDSPLGGSTPTAPDHYSDTNNDTMLEMPKVTDWLGREQLDIDRDFNVHLNEGDGVKLTFHKKRHRRTKAQIEADRLSQMRRLLMNQSAFSSDGEGQNEPMNLSASLGLSESFLNGSRMASMADSARLSQSLMEAGMVRKRRGRKRKSEKLVEIAASLAQGKHSVVNSNIAPGKHSMVNSNIGPESRVPVINIEDGNRLSGDEAPMKKDLDQWLDVHPGFMVDTPEPEDVEGGDREPFDKRRRRRQRIFPHLLDMNTVTGEENVSVINRETGRKITGPKAPPLRYLSEWLDQNPRYDVDAKWADLVRAKGNLPEKHESRILNSSSRGRRSRDAGLPMSMLPGDHPFSMAGHAAFPGAAMMAANFSKMGPFGLPFGALPNLAMANPMLGLAGYGGLPGFNLQAALVKAAETEAAEKEEASDKKDGQSSSKFTSTLTSGMPIAPHPSFPLMYNQLFYNPLMAAHGLRNFNLPGTLPTSFASLAGNAGVANGNVDSDSEEEGEIRRQPRKEVQALAEDLSVGKASPQDLTTKKKRHHHHHHHHHHHGSSSQSDGKSKKQSTSSSTKVADDTPTDLSIKPKLEIRRPKKLTSSKLNRILDNLSSRAKEKSLGTDGPDGGDSTEVPGNTDMETKGETPAMETDDKEETPSATDETETAVSPPPTKSTVVEGSPVASSENDS